MFWRHLFQPGPAQRSGERLYALAAAQARRPALYLEFGAPDTPDGRFELYTLHVLMALERLSGQGAAAKAVAQALFDAYISALDHGLRELAVGDLSVGKTMRRLGEAFYGRRQALVAALASLPDRGELEGVIGRTVFSGAAGADPGPLAGYVVATRERLAADAVEAMLEDGWAWPSPA